MVVLSRLPCDSWWYPCFLFLILSMTHHLELQIKPTVVTRTSYWCICMWSKTQLYSLYYVCYNYGTTTCFSHQCWPSSGCTWSTLWWAISTLEWGYSFYPHSSVDIAYRKVLHVQPEDGQHWWLKHVQGGSNMTGTDLYVNKPHCAAAVRPWESEATTSTLPPAQVTTSSVLSGSC